MAAVSTGRPTQDGDQVRLDRQRRASGGQQLVAQHSPRTY
jgi:hypothetical protein